jgi:6-phosphogluconolactonase
MKNLDFILSASLTLVSGMTIAQQQKKAGGIMYAGTSPGRGSKGIYVLRFDPEQKKLTELQTVTGKKNPNFLAVGPDEKHLYAIYSEGITPDDHNGTVMSFNIDPVTGFLTKLNEQSTEGRGPAHVSIDPWGKFAYVANYGAGNFSVYPLNRDGSLGKATEVIQFEGSGVNAELQKHPFVHSVFPSLNGKFIYVSALGLDKIMIYEVGRKGKLTPAKMPFEKSPPGSGPRHLAFHPNGKFAFSVEEITASVTSFQVNKSTGGLTAMEHFEMVPEDYSGPTTSGADIHVSPDGKFVYASVRGFQRIAIYSINQETGSLTFVGLEDTRGDHPRNFCMDKKGEFVFVANMNSDNIVIFKRDPVNGKLDYSGETNVPDVACIIQR